MGNRYQAVIDPAATNNTHSSLVRLTGTDRAVLELGASSGYMTRLLQERGCTVTAIENDPAVAGELAAVADTAVIANLEDPAALDSVPGPFDVVLAGDVLEHLRDPDRVLQQAVARLAPDGAVVLSVPNITHCDLVLSLAQGQFRYRDTGLLDATHVHFFTYQTLLEMLERAGLVPVAVERTVVPAFESELAVSRESVDPAVLEEVLRVPESQTYQFVVKAVRAPAAPEQQVLSRAALDVHERLIEESRRMPRRSTAGALAEQLATVQGFLSRAERDRDTARRQVTDLTAELQAAHDHLTAVRHERDADQAELQAIRDRNAETATQIADLEAELMEVRGQLRQACAAESERNRLREQADRDRRTIDLLTAELMQSRAAAGNPMDPRTVDRIVADQRAELAAADQDRLLLAEIRSSRSYRAVLGYRRLVERVAPSGSARRRAFCALTRAGRGTRTA
ncbi:MAG TPA: methyltransferase domain-containing protein [Nakamurella sp.]|nr:methyltransferase domain-containing protein [Nakamurella sp.]